MGLFPRFAPLLLLGLAIGCKQNSTLLLEDTEGRRFEARCEKTGGCSVRQSAGDAEFVLRAPGRVFGVCLKAQGAEPESAADCRPLGCAQDDGCPPPQGLERGQCVNGLCTEPSHPIGVTDAVMLCLAGTGSGRGSAQQAERVAMALNCGEPCRIPSPCRQP